MNMASMWQPPHHLTEIDTRKFKQNNKIKIPDKTDKINMASRYKSTVLLIPSPFTTEFD
jgi:hypothetical protein